MISSPESRSAGPSCNAEGVIPSSPESLSAGSSNAEGIRFRPSNISSSESLSAGPSNAEGVIPSSPQSLSAGPSNAEGVIPRPYHNAVDSNKTLGAICLEQLGRAGPDVTFVFAALVLGSFGSFMPALTLWACWLILLLRVHPQLSIRPSWMWVTTYLSAKGSIYGEEENGSINTTAATSTSTSTTYPSAKGSIYGEEENGSITTTAATSTSRPTANFVETDLESQLARPVEASTILNISDADQIRGDASAQFIKVIVSIYLLCNTIFFDLGLSQGCSAPPCSNRANESVRGLAVLVLVLEGIPLLVVGDYIKGPCAAIKRLKRCFYLMRHAVAHFRRDPNLSCLHFALILQTFLASASSAVLVTTGGLLVGGNFGSFMTARCFWVCRSILVVELLAEGACPKLAVTIFRYWREAVASKRTQLAQNVFAPVPESGRSTTSQLPDQEINAEINSHFEASTRNWSTDIGSTSISMTLQHQLAANWLLEMKEKAIAKLLFRAPAQAILFCFLIQAKRRGKESMRKMDLSSQVCVLDWYLKLQEQAKRRGKESMRKTDLNSQVYVLDRYLKLKEQAKSRGKKTMRKMDLDYQVCVLNRYLKLKEQVKCVAFCTGKKTREGNYEKNRSRLPSLCSQSILETKRAGTKKRKENYEKSGTTGIFLVFFGVEDAKTWLQDYGLFQLKIGLSEDEGVLQVFPLLFCGKAKCWFDGLHDEVKIDRDALEKAFDAELHEVKKKLDGMKQRLDGDFKAFEWEFEALLQKLLEVAATQNNDYLKLSKFMDCLHEDVRDKVEVDAPTTYADAVAYARGRTKKLLKNRHASQGMSSALGSKSIEAVAMRTQLSVIESLPAV
ncbi:hypothetical protein L7F22_029637 [Adiantum nelumboides]|nr:hypothetical protein [Adiantum nelumboides]